MEENPYKAPSGSKSLAPRRRLSIRACLIGVAVAIPIAFAAILVALVVAFFALPCFVDIRENPGYWDEIERRQKMGMTPEEAAKSISGEQRAAQHDAQ